MPISEGMYALGIVLARAGSKGLPDKCVRPVLGRSLIEYTFEHALAATELSRIVLTTDSPAAQRLADEWGIDVIDRPPALATDTARVDAAARHAVEFLEADSTAVVEAIVLLYANIPVRPAGIIDRTVTHLAATGCDSVRTVASVGRHHPDWLHQLEGDRMRQFRENGIFRRQDLAPLYYHDGAAAAVTRMALFSEMALGDDGQAFLGKDRRAIVLAPDDVVDVDTPLDLLLAESVLRSRGVARAGAQS